MLNQFITGLECVAHVNVLVPIFLGVLFGMIMGALPGLSTTMAIALALPLTFGMDKIPAMALFMGIFTGGVAGGMVSAILIGVPGTPAAVATCFDGAPMAKKGQAAKAIAASNWAALISGLLGTLVLIFLAPTLANYALKFSSFEYFSIGIFSLTLIITLAEESLVKGLLSGLIGVALTLVGTAPIDSTPRYTFGSTSLQAGFGTLPFLIAIFAMVAILDIAHQDPKSLKRDIGEVHAEGGKLTVGEMLGQTWNLLRSSLIGFGIGILPGIGAGTSNILAYMTAKNQSKHPEQFGKGALEGVVAPQAAGCAGTGGALTILMTVGVPGDAITAMLLGGLILHGLTPGPLMFITNGDVVYSIFVSLLVANIMMFLLMKFGTKLFIKVLSVPANYLYPIILILCVLGAFGERNNLFDVWCMLGLGLIAYFMTKLKFPTTPIILGFIIGSMVETNLRRGLMQSDGSFLPFFTRPLSAIFLVIALLSLIWSLYRYVQKKKMRTA